MENVNNVAKILFAKWKETVLETDNPAHTSEPARHINYHVIPCYTQQFKQSMLCNAPVQEHLRKNLEALFIGVLKPSLNEETNFEHFILLKWNFVIWCSMENELIFWKAFAKKYDFPWFPYFILIWDIYLLLKLRYFPWWLYHMFLELI